MWYWVIEIVWLLYTRFLRRYTLKFLPYVAPKRITDMLATKMRLKLHLILVLLSELFTIFGSNSLLIMVHLRTNFSSQQISASFRCNIGQKFLECKDSIFQLPLSETLSFYLHRISSFQEHSIIFS